ncbi:MAG: hypothetical protein CND89_01130 [Marine Group II euryarchaeote MED-G38]|nr:hypothetical protein [Euryarchaeota archaeon]OUV26288.1 MAG: hypothetical protein CBC57_02745 [Euryarchaeota archaeon TMED97]PDH23659.1 MAG: hypothetical protein CND89_01130 [Marine Group II euryarchaeote MED-G38]|tara:strand:- start:27798 stop:28835 length:1038 start_codon:yes stop_codon:yes gene_type:complete
MHNLGLIGGTFDRFHTGHKKLINGALEKCKKIEIWIISDEIARKNNTMVMSWESRKNEIINSLGKELMNRIEFGILEDNYGPAPNHPKANAIICTLETYDMCLEINEMRENNNLKILEIIKIDHENAWDGFPISSTRIRNGEINREGQIWTSSYFEKKNNDVISKKLIMTKEAEIMLKQPFGELIEGKDKDYEYAMKIMIEKYLKEDVPLISVGDVTTLTLENLGCSADIAWIDGKTKRERWAQSENIDSKKYNNNFTCYNPAGELTKSLFETCKKSLEEWIRNKSTSLIIVDGEEDLAPLMIHLIAPLGTIVVYGQPGKGVVVRITKEDTKKRCRDILSSFEFC